MGSIVNVNQRDINRKKFIHKLSEIKNFNNLKVYNILVDKELELSGSIESHFPNIKYLYYNCVKCGKLRFKYDIVPGCEKTVFKNKYTCEKCIDSWNNIF